MKKRNIIFSALLVLGVVGFAVHSWTYSNYIGYCSEVGRPLTKEEKKIRISDFVLNELRTKKNTGGFFRLAIWNARSILIQDSIISSESSKAYIISDINDKSTADVFIYPETPEYALKKGVDGNKQYDESHSGAFFYPVSSYYKYIGYAQNLYFIDFNLYIQPKTGDPWQAKIDWRGWINNCAKMVQLPEKFVKG